MTTKTPERLVLIHATLAYALPVGTPIDAVYDSANMDLIPLQRLHSGDNLIDYTFHGVSETSAEVDTYDYENGFKMPPAPRYEVLTSIGPDWENVWTVDGVKQTFASPADALAELLEHIADLIESGMDFNPCDFKIEPVKEGA